MWLPQLGQPIGWQISSLGRQFCSGLLLLLTPGRASTTSTRKYKGTSCTNTISHVVLALVVLMSRPGHDTTTSAARRRFFSARRPAEPCPFSMTETQAAPRAREVPRKSKQLAKLQQGPPLRADSRIPQGLASCSPSEIDERPPRPRSCARPRAARCPPSTSSIIRSLQRASACTACLEHASRV